LASISCTSGSAAARPQSKIADQQSARRESGLFVSSATEFALRQGLLRLHLMKPARPNAFQPDASHGSVEEVHHRLPSLAIREITPTPRDATNFTSIIFLIKAELAVIEAPALISRGGEAFASRTECPGALPFGHGTHRTAPNPNPRAAQPLAWLVLGLLQRPRVLLSYAVAHRPFRHPLGCKHIERRAQAQPDMLAVRSSWRIAVASVMAGYSGGV
jgi:hypothetical protein